MEGVDIKDGLEYGFKLMGYYIGVAVVGSVLTAVGVGITLFEGLKVVLAIAVAFIPSSIAGSVPVGAAQAGPNVGLILLALVVVIAGILLVFAGLFGALYKLIADAVAEGNRLSGLEEGSTGEGETTGDDIDSAGEGDADTSEADDTVAQSEVSDGDEEDTDADPNAANEETSETEN
jgi:hypothetical protein